jgi:hypothetical protein
MFVLERRSSIVDTAGSEEVPVSRNAASRVCRLYEWIPDRLSRGDMEKSECLFGIDPSLILGGMVVGTGRQVMETVNTNARRRKSRVRVASKVQAKDLYAVQH